MINHQKNKEKTWHYDRFGGWQPIKATKLTILEFIYAREMITAFDLMEKFDYTYSSAHCRLSLLRKEGFIQRTGGGHWCLSDRGYDKLDHSGSLKRQAEGRVWYIEDDKVRMAKNVDEMLLVLAKAKKIIRELKEARLT